MAEKQLDISNTSDDVVVSTDHAEVAFGHEVDGDEALKAVGGLSGPVHIDAATNKRLVRRIDMMIMPLLCVVYGLQFLDKTTLSYASVTGIQKDIGLKGDNYQWLSAIFYFGYLAFNFIAVRALQYFPLAKYSGACILAWGIVIACFAAVENFAGAVVIRLLMGCFEACISPAWALLTSQWYRKEEQSVRTAWWFCFNGFAQIFGGVVAYGIAHGNTVHGFTIAPWKIIFLFTGLLTIFFGTIFLLWVPDNQLNARWLTAEDRVLAIERVRDNQQGIGNKHFKLYQLKEAFLDPMTWAMFFLAIVSNVPNGGVTNFNNLLIESLGYDSQRSLLLGSISGAMEVVALLCWGYASRYTEERTLWAPIGPAISCFGAILIVALPFAYNKGRLAGLFLLQFQVTGFVSMISMISSNVAGYTKKTTVAGGYFIFYCVGNIIGPQTFRPEDAPYYRPAEVVLVVFYGLCVVDLLFIRYWYLRQNKKKELIRSQPGYTKLENQEFLDLTDRENPEFVYSL